MPWAFADQGGADHFDTVTPADQGVFGQEDMGLLARTADRAAKPTALAVEETSHLPLDPRAPRTQRLVTIRAAEASCAQPRLDNGRVSPYDDHSGARFVRKSPLVIRLRIQRGGSCAFYRPPPSWNSPPPGNPNSALVMPIEHVVATMGTGPCPFSMAPDGSFVPIQVGAQHGVEIQGRGS